MNAPPPPVIMDMAREEFFMKWWDIICHTGTYNVPMSNRGERADAIVIRGAKKIIA